MNIPSSDFDRVKEDVNHLKGNSREFKLLLRICTGAMTIVCAILIPSIPSWIRTAQRTEDNQEAISRMAPKVDQMFWTMFPAQARQELERDSKN